jgi:hypothetical protein
MRGCARENNIEGHAVFGFNSSRQFRPTRMSWPCLRDFKWTPWDEITPCLGQQAYPISSEAILGRNTGLDCSRTNSAVVAKSRSFVPSDLTASPDAQIQSAQQAEPSLVFRCSTPNSLACQPFHLAGIASLEPGCEPVRFNPKCDDPRYGKTQWSARKSGNP